MSMPRWRGLVTCVFVFLAVGGGIIAVRESRGVNRRIQQAKVIVVRLLGGNTATGAKPRGDNWWHERHAENQARLRSGPVGVVFAGDSIMANWESKGEAAWAAFYGDRSPVNLGFWSDRTEHLLWRVRDLEFSESPRLVILLIGANNIGLNSAREIGEGILANLKAVQKKTPESAFLIVAILPRGDVPEKSNRKLREASRIASRCAEEEGVWFVDIGDRFVDEDGEIRRDLLPDGLHPSAEGYRVWAEAMEPTVRAILGEQSHRAPVDAGSQEELAPAA